MERIAESELVLNQDGSIYHLNLLPENIAETIILVGDQGRVVAARSRMISGTNLRGFDTA